MKYKCAGIVLYNPDLNRLRENITALYDQVECIIVIDNHSINFNEFIDKYNKDPKIIVMKNDENNGVATALNQLAYKAKEIGYDWILLLDQDSVCSKGMMDAYQKYIYNQDIALLCPYIIDINKMTLEQYYNLDLPETSELIWAITSGSFINIEILFRLGGFDEYLFIDGVDIEYSKRLHANNYAQLRINSVYLLQEVGNAEVLKIKRPHMDMTGKWSWKPFYRTNHSPLRRYFMVRNSIIIAKKYKYYKSYIKEILHILVMAVFWIIIEKKKVTLFKYMKKGLIDGLKYKIKPY